MGRSTYYTEGNAVSNEYNYDFAERYVSSYNTKGYGTDTITYDKNNNNTGYRAFLKRNALDIAYLTSYTYTNVNNMDKMTVPASTVLDNTYDGYGRLSSTSTTTSGGSRALTTSLTYVDNGSQYASHLLDTYNVHFSGASSADYAYNYDYDNSGNVTTATINLSGTTTDTVYDYTYDSLNQLKRETKTGSTSNYDTTYNYDNRGNLTSKQTTGSSSSSATYTYGTQNGLEVLTKYTKTGTGAVTREYSYDNAGNPSTIDEIKSGTEKNYSLSWTQGKKLQRYSGGSIDNRYCYNESGLVSKLTKVNNTTVEYYYDDGLLEYEEYRNSSGTLQRVHKYFYDSDGTVRFLLTKTGNFDNSNNFNLYAYIYDGTGNITDLVRLQREGSSTPTAVVEHAAHYEYDAFGKILSSTNKGSGESIASLNPIKYKGYYYDAEIAMYRLETRFYDPEIGRFLNADDLSLLQETPSSLGDKNLYAYCDNNPVMRKDSNGEFWHVVAGAVINAGVDIACSLVAGEKITLGSVARSLIEGAATSLCPARKVIDIAYTIAVAAYEGGCAAYKDYQNNGSVWGALTAAGTYAGLSVIGGKAGKSIKNSVDNTPPKGNKILNNSKKSKSDKNMKKSQGKRKSYTSRGKVYGAIYSGYFGAGIKVTYSGVRFRQS